MIEGKFVVEHKGLMGGIRSGLMGAMSASSPSGLAGGIGKMVGQLGLLAGVGGVIAEGVMKLVEIGTAMSGIFKAVGSGLIKQLQFLLKPIGDILGTALMPIYFILKPIGRFFNAMMRPYIRRAMEAMRLGGRFMEAGEPGLAAESFSLGFQYLFKPIADSINNVLLPFFSKLGIELTPSIETLDTQLGSLMGRFTNFADQQVEYVMQTSQLITKMVETKEATDSLRAGFEGALPKFLTWNGVVFRTKTIMEALKDPTLEANMNLGGLKQVLTNLQDPADGATKKLKALKEVMEEINEMEVSQPSVNFPTFAPLNLPDYSSYTGQETATSSYGSLD